jgi:hypothetical protein
MSRSRPGLAWGRAGSIVLLGWCILPACSGGRGLTAPIEARTIALSEGQALRIELAAGEVILRGGEAGLLRIEGLTADPDPHDPVTETTQSRVRIAPAGGRTFPARLEIQVPNRVPVSIETDEASIQVLDYEGELEAESVSGDIRLERVAGAITVRSNRGGIRLTDGRGRVSVVGNYGILELKDTRGEVGVSTIMGSVVFGGLISEGDRVRLETDHGPVSVNLASDSSLILQVRSTSGDLACLLPGLAATLRTCEGAMGSAEGLLEIRTVSGGVTLQSTP